MNSPQPPPGAGSSGPKRILVVEDEAIVAIDIARQLESLGYEVAGMAGTGHDAIELARNRPPDLVLMDIQLQEKMEGIETAILLRRDFHLPIVFLTAFSEDAIIRQVETAEPFGFIVKPFEIRELKAVIRMALDRAESQAQNQKIIENLRRSEENYRNLFENAVEGVFISTPSAKLLSVNPAMARMFGFASPTSMVESIGDIAKEIYAQPEQRQTFLKLLAENGRLENFEMEARRADGQRIWLSINAHAHRDKNGAFLRFDGTCVDVTERKLAKDELKRHQDRLEETVRERTAELTRTNSDLRKLWRAIENSPSSVVITDRAGRIEYVNPRFCQVSEYSLEESIGQNPRVLKSGVHPPEFYLELWRTIAAGNTWRGEICNKSKKGRFYWEQVSISPVRNREQITHFVAIKEDITENRMVAEELRRAKEAAESANRAKTVFLANMSHEIRTPMNAILGFSQLLRQDPHTTPHQKQYLDIINRSGEHLLALINDILEMSKIEAGRVQLNSVTFDLYAMLSDLESVFRPRAEAKGLRLVTQFDENIPRYLLGDDGKLRQILINLLGNAVKFTEKGHIVFRVLTDSATPSSVRLIASIEDTGPGIKPLERTQLFRSFAQTETGRHSVTGTGLGLAISREFARLMQGDITVHDNVEVGTIFRLEIPLDLASAPSLPAPGRTAQPILRLNPRRDPPKILIVEDSSDTRLLLSEILTKAGFQLAQAEDGAQALVLFESFKPDLILTDMRMPELDGFELTRRIRAAASKVRIVSLSAGAFEEDRQKALNAGVDAFLGKPFRTSQMFEAIRNLLGSDYFCSDSRDDQSTATANAMQVNLSSVPPELVEQMRDAIRRADLDQLLELIEKTAVSSPQVAESLSHLATNYNYRALAQLLGIQDSHEPTA